MMLLFMVLLPSLKRERDSGEVKGCKQRIGISGGTFNPIHLGHLIIAEMARDRFGLDKVLFIPSGMPPHKNLGSVLDAEQRFDMVRRAVAGNSYFEESRIEIDRVGYTYTVDTLKKLRELYGSDAILYYIIGADVLHDLVTWKSFEEVFKICEFIAALRPGNNTQDFYRQMEYLKDTYGAVIHFIETPLIEISSTDIRKRIKEGRSIKYLVPESVEEYIKSNKLYGE